MLDALSIGASILRGDFDTAGSVMFLLNLGSLLEEWTRKKSLDDLARSMALNVDKVWVRSRGRRGPGAPDEGPARATRSWSAPAT